MVCGVFPLAGLSPRVRGNPTEEFSAKVQIRSIPAGAGEPLEIQAFRYTSRVYPRGCGGTFTKNAQWTQTAGLSPRVRGNRAYTIDEALNQRSIPAGAGEPSCYCHQPSATQVYPRGCGGTLCTLFDYPSSGGLSPRVRGNRLCQRGNAQYGRSIPAGAGEPTVSETASRYARVYPRGCGGTYLHYLYINYVKGLSPRVRGNPSAGSRWSCFQRSIPAGAGEPLNVHPTRHRIKVYPRGCGGTPRHHLGANGMVGLSPRVRGNPLGNVFCGPKERSIPAGAGEPALSWRSPTSIMVYPRGCGGTKLIAEHVTAGRGLSPRVRGNHCNPFAGPAG